MLKRLGCAAVGVMMLSGCSLRVTDFTVISTKNVNVPVKQQAARTKGEDCVAVVLVPLGVPNLKEAIDKAIENAGPGYDALIDGVAYFDNFNFFFGKQCYRVEGTPINTKGGAAAASTQGETFHSSKGSG